MKKEKTSTTTVLKMPEDFLEEGHSRQIAWCRDGFTDRAWVVDKYIHMNDLPRLAKWLCEAAVFLAQEDKKTKK